MGKGQKAAKVAKAITKGVKTTNKKVRTSIKFHLPKTLKLARQPKYTRKYRPRVNKLDRYQNPQVPTYHRVRHEEDRGEQHPRVRCGHPRKQAQIKEAIRKMYEPIEVSKINTLIRPDGQKKAYVCLTPDFDALDVANQIGII